MRVLPYTLGGNVSKFTRIAMLIAVSLLTVQLASSAHGDNAPVQRDVAWSFGRAPAAGVGHASTTVSRQDTRGNTICTKGETLPYGDGGDLLVIGTCYVKNGGKYEYRNVNIISDTAAKTDGSLIFQETTANERIDFWAKSILVEYGGSLLAGTDGPDPNKSTITPFGSMGGVLVIHLWGAPPTDPTKGHGIQCKSDTKNQCGIPDNVWTSNIANTPNPTSCESNKLPGGVTDCFYQYKPLKYSDGYFGYKTLAVSYGGTLRLFGKKGAIYSDNDTDCKPSDPSCSGTSWVRLQADPTLYPTGVVPASADTLTLSRAVDWAPSDKIVIGSTDYLPGHAEECEILDGGMGTATIKIGNCVAADKPLAAPPRSGGLIYPHNGKEFDISKVPTRVGLGSKSVDTRAPVGLLTRSIRIVGAGNEIGKDFPPPPKTDSDPTYYFGGQTIVRQGYKTFQMQGVEFHDLGQGGRIGRYAVHFHMVRQASPDTFVDDCSVWDSMTRWYVLHASQGITLARDVGYLSIGHGYYLEDGTETDNKLYSDLGIFARGAVEGGPNPRRIPGILGAGYNEPPGKYEHVPYHTDIDHPSVFWIMNGWNDFEYNVADGAGTCGMCYWLVPGSISGPSVNEYWTGYAAEQTFFPDKPFVQDRLARAAMTPLDKFVGNTCMAAMNSFEVIGNTTACLGVTPDPNVNLPRAKPVHNQLAPAAPPPDPKAPNVPYYPNVSGGGGRFATRCGGTYGDCHTVSRCDGSDIPNCMVTVLDDYTSSFNWAETNFSAIWLRPEWNLVINSAFTDMQNGGLSFVTGGGYTRSDEIKGYWSLARKDVFIGHTQTYSDADPYVSEAGPFNPKTKKLGLKCATQESGAPAGSYCLSKQEGISMPLSNFGVNQRFFNIYDGPSYEDSNAYLDITPTTLTGCSADPKSDNPCPNTTSGWMYSSTPGIPYTANDKACYLPNAAIAWKQPNGFYYPPAFHSRNLFFDNVPIRHFVIEPQFKEGTFFTNVDKAKARYCTWRTDMFDNWTDVDRQTELTDDDGTLTGLSSDSESGETISVNEDPFFNAPFETTECASDVAANSTSDPTLPPATAKTSPYEYVTTALYPGCGEKCKKEGYQWSIECSNENCYGVPMYRQITLPREPTAYRSIRLMGQNVAQRSSLTVNHGSYYIDTTVSAATQEKVKTPAAAKLSVFSGGQTYYVYLLYARPTTTQTYSMYVGEHFDPGTVKMVRVNVNTPPFQFTPGSWPSSWPQPSFDPSTGILTVTMNMDNSDFRTNYSAAQESDCQPNSFCAWDDTNKQCKCNLDSSNYLFDECGSTTDPTYDPICSWAGKDVSCPEGGCYGFSFTLPSNFNTTLFKPLVPPPTCATEANNPGLNVSFVGADNPGACAYSSLPSGKFCQYAIAISGVRVAPPKSRGH